jgi:putative transcriptional regulator
MDKTLLENAHDMAKGLFAAGAIDLVTMREFDAKCLPEVKVLTPAAIKKLRTKEKVSQSVFAKFLNTTLSTVRQWERGEKHPRGTSLKLLNLVCEKGLEALV